MQSTIKQQPETTFFEGGKRAVILFHAYTGTPNDVRAMGRFLNNAGYTVLLPMFEGHGTETPVDVLEYGPKYWQKNVEESIEFLKKRGHNEIAVFGLSLGGEYAMKTLTDNREEIIGGGAFCSPLVPKFETNIRPVFLQFAKQAAEKMGETLTGEALATVTEKLDKQLVELISLTDVIYNEMPNVKVPTLLVQAGKDRMINPQTVYEAKEQLSAADVTVKWYENSGHVITIGPDRLELQDDVLAFIESLSWSQS